jgi:diadenosine tetraphosphate (Ap4A) HIT family hydrolase
MLDFQLHERLAQDSYPLGILDSSQVLLMRNAHFPWLVLVPNSSEKELHHLPEPQQLQVLQQIRLLSRFVEENFPCDKLNVACIGNIVPQLHIHIIGRTRNDICWPNPVWGTREFKAYTTDEVTGVRQRLQTYLDQHATR